MSRRRDARNVRARSGRLRCEGGRRSAVRNVRTPQFPVATGPLAADTRGAMRWPRAGIVVGLIGLVLLGAGWWLASIGAAGPIGDRGSVGAVGHRVPPVIGAPAPKSLRGALQLYLARSNPLASRSNRLPAPLASGPRTPRNLPSVTGTTCPVAAGGFCSLTPCVVYAGGGSAVASV